jgi:alkylation response protein AidB-like acyl-CoA dehydrogenase
LDFNLTAEQLAFQTAIRRFAERNLKDGALARAHADGYPWDVARLAARQGILGITLPVEDGGQGGTLLDAVIALQAVASECPRSADVIQAGNFGAIRVLSEYGSPPQKERFLKRLLAGEGVISVAMSEPEAGSAVTELKTTATRDGDGFRIKGTKVFTTHAPYAGVILVYVRFGRGVDGIGAVLVETGSDGFSYGQPTRFMSDEEWRQLYFDEVFVPADMVLLKEGGFRKLIAGFNVERLGNAARSIALGRYAYETARQWALQRKQFGRLLCEFQGIQWKFAEMRVKLDAAQLLLYRAAANADSRFPSAEETAIAKLACNQAGFEVANEALQVMGGTGYSKEVLVEYCFRRCRGWMIAGGSLEILKNRIAESVFERTFPQRPSKGDD